MESQKEARLPPRRGPGGDRGSLAQSPGQYKCGEPLLALEGRRRTLAAVLGRTDWPGKRDSAACAVGRKQGKGEARRPGLAQLLVL